ncbi:hypothetical protein PHK61_25135 [Actinomycetospora lutea]|nr:hypothetical protein [Actinomycetospora lutea]MDD7941709.1 hypothetical protein [Actinomycetospora lutea]
MTPPEVEQLDAIGAAALDTTGPLPCRVTASCPGEERAKAPPVE